MEETLIQATNNNHTIEPANQNQNQNKNKNPVPQNENEDNGNKDTEGVSEIQPENNRTQPMEIVGANQENDTNADRTSLISKKVGFVGFGAVAAAAMFSPLCALPNPGSAKLKMRVGDILDSHMWPSHFLALISISFAFSSGFLMAVVPLWKMIRGWEFYFWALLLVTAVGFYATFCFTLNEKLPNFTFGNLPGFLVVWMLGISLDFFLVATYAIILKAWSRMRSA
ncbi:unnamed protein product [Camellia sinensis]